MQDGRLNRVQAGRVERESLCSNLYSKRQLHSPRIMKKYLFLLKVGICVLACVCIWKVRRPKIGDIIH